MKFRVGDAVSVRTTEAVWPRHTEGKVITIETDEEEEPYEVMNSAGQEPKTWWFSEDELELVSAARPEPARCASGGKVWWKAAVWSGDLPNFTARMGRAPMHGGTYYPVI